MGNARKIAAEILNKIEKDKVFSNIEISKRVKELKDIRDKNFVRELVYGVLENKLYVDNILKNFSKTKIAKIDDIILQILRLGIYQIYFMENLPESAICNEAVKNSKSLGKKRLSGFVNGILRNIIRNKDKEFLPDKNKNLIEYLSIKYSHPKWIVETYIDDYGGEFAEDILRANNETPPLTIRVNTLKVSRQDLMEILDKYDIETFKTKFSRDGLIVVNPRNVIGLKEFKEGLFTVQDESSQLVAHIMEPRASSKVLDTCSAPGGKSTHIAQIMNNKGIIVARDIFDHKLKLVEENSKRLGVDIIKTQNYDALTFDQNMEASLDYCLVDAPCSGLGLLRRKPDIRWNKTRKDIKSLTKLQLEILNNVSRYLKKDGILIYSTCTLSKDENINLINSFLKDNDFYKLEKIDNLDIDNPSLEKGYIELFPNIHGSDGFFIAKLKRIR